MKRTKKHPSASKKQIVAIFGFTFLYIATAVAASLIMGNHEFVFTSRSWR